MHNLPSRAVVAVARYLRDDADPSRFDDHAAARYLGLHRKTIAYALKQLGALGAISYKDLPSGPRSRRSGVPVRAVELHPEHWLWLVVEQLSRTSDDLPLFVVVPDEEPF